MTDAFLAGDVGATNARLAIATFANGTIEWLHEARCADAALRDFDAALDALFAASPVPRTAVRAACLGVAGPIHGRRARFTNRDWAIDAGAVGATLGGAPVALVNDLEAAASGIDLLPERDLAVLQRRSAVAGGVRLVIGAGTGLGIAYAVACDGRYRIIASEGGHAGFAPGNARQRWLAEALRAELDRGGGPAAITRAALEHADPLASDALDLFIDCYGTVAGDHALAVLPYGGVFVVGGIAAKILPRLEAGGFVRAFTAKGAFAGLAGTFPVAVVTNERLGLVGAARIARDSVPASEEGSTTP